MKQAEKVQWSVKQTCFFGTSIVNVLIGKMRQRCRDSVYHVRSLLSSVCFPLSYELIFNHHIGRVSLDCPLIQQKEEVVFVVM